MPADLICITCRQSSPRGLTCPDCTDATALTGVISASLYSSTALRRGIGWFKFKGVRSLAPLLASLIQPRLLSIAPLPILQKQAVLIPLPLHPRRERERGFNQSRDLVRELSEATNIPVSEALCRTRVTWSQAQLPMLLRHHNITTAFTVAPEHQSFLADKIALIVDDVTTSGATLTAAATALSPALVNEIWGVTIARG